jgi:transcription elongation GreA/GreB family factor
VNDQPCTLTIADFGTLTALQKEWTARAHPLSFTLRQKLNGARVVFPGDIPRDVATLGSCVAYTVDRGRSFTRTLTGLTGLGPLELPVTVPLGLALVGRREGEAFPVREPDGARIVELHRVTDQPEAAWPGRFRSR